MIQFGSFKRRADTVIADIDGVYRMLVKALAWLMQITMLNPLKA